MCIDLYENTPHLLPGSGKDLASRLRRCISECVSEEGCSPYLR